MTKIRNQTKIVLSLLKSIIKTMILIWFFNWLEEILQFVLVGIWLWLFALWFLWSDFILVVKSWLFKGCWLWFTSWPTVFGLVQFTYYWVLCFIDFETVSEMPNIVKIGPYTLNKCLRLNDLSDLIKYFFVMFFLSFYG